MTKSELIKELSAIDGDPDVMIARDPEGNGYYSSRDVELSGTDAEGEPCHPDDDDTTRPKVIVIWP